MPLLSGLTVLRLYDILITMSTRTIVCKMAPTPVMAKQLADTCTAFSAACNTAMGYGEANNIRLHHLAYRTIRDRHGLSANLAVRAIRRVSAAMTVAKRRGKQPKQFRPTSIDYDARIFAYRERDETVSLNVVGGRIHVPLVLGTYQRTALAGKKPTAATVVRNGNSWSIHIVVDEPDAEQRTGPALGVDMGIRNTATTSDGTLHDGTERQRFKERRNRVRASLQSNGTQGAKVVLRRLSGYENRRIRHENHVLSRRIVDEAVKAHCGTIRMELLTGIRQRTRVWNKHSNRMIAGWSFGQLQGFIAYKAQHAGLAVEFVDPAYTSQTCSKCGMIGARRQDIFRCTSYGVSHADINAAVNIAAGAARKPARIEADCVALATHDALESRLL